MYYYDSEGNLQTKNSRKSSESWQYRWNASGMLSQVIRPDSSEVNFKYDALGRRISKEHQGKTTRWVWDGNSPLHEWTEFASLQQSYDDTITWVFDTDGFTPIARLVGDESYSIITNHRNTA